MLIAPEELDALDPKATKTIDIEEFVDLAEIDPIYYDHNYYLAPTAGGAKAYRLLLDAMREAGKVGIGRVVLRSKQQLCALRPTGEVLTLTTMLFGDEVLSPGPDRRAGRSSEAEATERELTMAQQLIDSLSAEFDPPSSATSTASECWTLIERKAAGEEIAVQPQAEEPAAAPDLMAALEASLAAMGPGEDESAPAPKKTAAEQGPGEEAGQSPRAATAARGPAAAAGPHRRTKVSALTARPKRTSGAGTRASSRRRVCRIPATQGSLSPRSVQSQASIRW